jgi:hypothetical protein
MGVDASLDMQNNRNSGVLPAISPTTAMNTNRAN